MSYDHSQDAIAPHGGVLVDRFADAKTRADIVAQVERGALPEIQLNIRELADLEMIACGALSPLTGFMGQADYERVVGEGRLAGGLPWTIPVTLSVRAEVGDKLAAGAQVALRAPDGKLVGALTVSEVFSYDKHKEARNVFGTEDVAHPAVGYLLNEMGDRLLGGQITMLDRTTPPFPAHHREPRATRKLFREKGWKRIVAFQTRNPIHRAHEFITKVALEICDGLLVHPLVGYTKEDDIPAETRMKCYEALLDRVLSRRPRGPLDAAGGDALRRPEGSDLSRHHAQELRLLALHRRARSRRRGQLLRHLRRAEDLRQLQRRGDRDHPAPLRAQLLLPSLRRDGHGQDLPTRQVAPRLFVRHQGPRHAPRRRASARGVLARPEVADILIAAMRN